MPDFVIHANIAHYQKLLGRETDPVKIATLNKLLAEEVAKLEDWQTKQSPPRAAE